MKERFSDNLRKVLPIVVLGVMLATTVMTWLLWQRSQREKAVLVFRDHVTWLSSDLSAQLNEYMAVMQSGAAIFIASNEVTQPEWDTFFEFKRILSAYPGIETIGFLDRDRQKIELHSPQNKADHYPLIELFNSDPSMKTALNKARDSGDLAASGILDTAENVAHTSDEPNSPHFAMFYPVYSTGTPPATTPERRAALEGFIFSVISADRFMWSIHRDPEISLKFQIRDKFPDKPGAAIFTTPDYAARVSGSEYDQDAAKFRTAEEIEFGQHLWSIDIVAAKGFDPIKNLPASLAILLGGLTVSFLVFYILLQEKIAKDKATAMAQTMTSELRQSESRFRTMIDRMMEGIHILDPDLKYIYANDVATRQLGLPKSNLAGTSLASAIPDFESTPLHASLKRSLKKKTPLRLEFEMTASDGQPRIFDLSVQHTPEGLQILSTDITDKRKSEREHIARMAAEEASKAKSTFLASMSHDIRTPLNAIIGFTQLLRRDDSQASSRADYLETIERSGEHLLELINDILDFSKIEAGELTLRHDVFDPREFMRDIEAVFKPRAETKGIRYVQEFISGELSLVGDSGKLRQVLYNLIGNAIKFTSEGGISVRVREESVPRDPKESASRIRIVCEVEDTGPGIHGKAMDRLFIPFQQGEAGGIHGGTGLGLAISREIIRAMGGDITVTSTVGKGACFRFEALFDSTDVVAASRSESDNRIIGLERQETPVRVLVADDNSDNRRYLKELLAPSGFEAYEARDGQEALDAINSLTPHIILMDMRMPILDGYEATKRIKASPSRRGIPVVGLTASAFEEDKAKVLAAGADAYLRKPFRPSELFSIMGRLLGIEPIRAAADGKDQNKAHFELNAESLSRIPESLREKLRTAVEVGDMRSFAEQLHEVDEIDSRISFSIRELADFYEYEKLMALLGRKDRS